jgi:hypothetical protein
MRRTVCNDRFTSQTGQVADERRAYKNDLPGSRRAPCLGCGKTIVTAREPHVPIGGRRDGSLLIEIDVEPLLSHATDVDALFRADDLYLLGVAHRDCRNEAKRRLTAREIDLPEELPQLHADDEFAVGDLPALNLPPTLDRCPFCDARETTEEHVFPQWLSKELQSIGSLVRPESGASVPLRKLDITAPICMTCNNRWLSVLENDTKPLLTRMLRGEDQRLFHDEQKLLATWALKTAMMLDLASGQPVIPVGFLQALRQLRQPFPSSLVWIAGYGGSTWATWAQHSGLHLGVTEEQRPNGFVTTFTVFRVAFQVVGHFTHGGAVFDDNRIYAPALAQIFPLKSLPVERPPNHVVFDDEWLEKLAVSIDG